MYSQEIYAPGTILQVMYLRERILNLAKGRYIEVGVGQGYVSKLLLGLGWEGIGFELASDAVNSLNVHLDRYIEEGKFKFVCRNYIGYKSNIKYDLIISSMVLEHLSDSDVDSYLETSINCLSDKGRIILILPANMQAWGVEDEIAGHYRRYDRRLLQQLACKHDLKISHIAGLTYPLSNILLPLSNFLVNMVEHQKRHLSMQQRTVASGCRNIPYKTNYPFVAKLILNEFMMYPLYILQKIFRKSNSALVLYVELVR